MARRGKRGKCILAKGELAGADRRFRYVPYRCLDALQLNRLKSGMYPYSTPGIPASAYAYPIDSSGRIASARRTLMWGYKYLKRKVRRS